MMMISDIAEMLQRLGRRDPRAVSAPVDTTAAADTTLRCERAECELLAMQSLFELNAALSRRIEEETARAIEREHLLLRQTHHAAMGEMVASITHQWRQPLNALGLILQNLRLDARDGLLDDAALHAYLDRAQAIVEQIEGTIEDFRLFFSGQAQMEEFSLLGTAQKCAVLVEASLKAHSITLTREGDDVRLFGFEREFLHVLLNLVANARQAIIERAVAEGRITVRIGRSGRMASVCVGDNAGGIDPQLIDRIFEPYFTTRPNGTGIGLHMSRLIVEEHMHGHLWAENGPQGAQFRMLLPLRPPSETGQSV